jgi:hypothetical protein
MSPKPDHSWILSVLKDIEVYAEIHDQAKVAALVSAAGNAVRQVLGADMTESHNVDGKEEQSFTVVLEELARYCHIHGLTETEEHLLAALDSWAIEQRPNRIFRSLLIFPVKN